MKKQYLFAATAGLLLAACQQEELPGISTGEVDKYICFGAPAIRVEADTRSVAKDELGSNDAFGVLGYCVPYVLGQSGTFNYNAGSGLWGAKYELCPPSVFYKQMVTVGGGEYCIYEGQKQWYVDGKGLDGLPNEAVTNADNYRYTFFAYYPYEGAFTVDTPASADDAGAPKFTFTMPQTGNNLNGELEHADTPDAMFAQPVYNHRREQGCVDFTFSHLLTALGFEVNNFSEYNLTVHSITLSGRFYKQIVLDFSQTGTLETYIFPESYYTGTYTIFDDAAGLVLNPVEGQESVSSGLLPRNAEGEGEHILLISGAAPYFGPDYSGDNQIKVTINYTFDDDENADAVPVAETQSFTRPETFIPTPGTKYTAQLNFVGNAFVLQFVVDNGEMWENGGSDDNFTGEDDSDVSGDIIFE